MLTDKRILGIFAHREDFVCFGWPVFQNNKIARSLLVCTNDGEVPVAEVCKKENITWSATVGIDNRFSFMGLRSALMANHLRLIEAIGSAIALTRPDYILTHNPMGEYGHYDHTMIFRLLYNYFPKQNLIISDIMANSSYNVPLSEIPRLYRPLYQNPLCEVAPDLDWYKRNGDIFKKHDLWTANKGLNLPTFPAKPAGLFLLERDHADS